MKRNRRVRWDMDTQYLHDLTMSSEDDMLFEGRSGAVMVLTEHSIPESLLRALEAGELDGEQLRELIEIEAAALGLSFDEAVARARANTLPQTPDGFDLQFHVMMLTV
jgi:hypothetical protein